MENSWIELDEKIKIMYHQPDGVLIFALWIWLLSLSLKLSTNLLVYRKDGTPYTTETLSESFGLKSEIVKNGIEFLINHEMIKILENGFIQITDFNQK